MLQVDEGGGVEGNYVNVDGLKCADLHKFVCTYLTSLLLLFSRTEEAGTCVLQKLSLK